MHFNSEADARSYMAELNYAIANPEEEDMTPDQIQAAKSELAYVKAFLATTDED
jgi:hypothetical protein